MRFKKIKPEKQVEQAVHWWACRNDIWLNVYDSKGSYSEAKGRYSKNLGLVKGHPDFAGYHKSGLAVVIELKAEGKLNNTSLEQYQYLVRCLDYNVFAVVADSVERVDYLWTEWNNLRKNQDPKTASQFLLNELPKKITHGGRIIPSPRA